jgi:hypothetical protein
VGSQNKKHLKKVKVQTTPEGAGLAKIEIGSSEKGIDHNYPCPVCQTSQRLTIRKLSREAE